MADSKVEGEVYWGEEEEDGVEEGEEEGRYEVAAAV